LFIQRKRQKCKAKWQFLCIKLKLLQQIYRCYVFLKLDFIYILRCFNLSFIRFPTKKQWFNCHFSLWKRETILRACIYLRWQKLLKAMINCNINSLCIRPKWKQKPNNFYKNKRIHFQTKLIMPRWFQFGQKCKKRWVVIMYQYF
jgi:hypothetical protein